MSLAEKTKPLEKGDGRLKILWIDDNHHDFVRGDFSDEETWFAIICASGPADIGRLLSTPTDSAAGAPSRLIYEHRGFPFDAYVTDFRLCNARDNTCSVLPAHMAAGMHAPSAGFLIGLLTAFRWTDHPQSIIPYSAYEEEFGQIWKLSQSVCPPSVHVLWDDSVSKTNRNPEEILKLVGPTVRQCIVKATAVGTLQMPFAERHRWEEILKSASDTVQATETVWFVGQYGFRPFLLGGVFYDCLDKQQNTIPVGALRNWLECLPVDDHHLIGTARRLAEFYWNLRCSDLSKINYAFISKFKAGEKKPADWPSPSSWQYIFKWQHPDKEHAIRVKRLAILFLLLLEHAGRKRRPESDLPEEVRKMLDLIGLLRRKHGLTNDEALDSVRLMATEANMDEDKLEALLILLTSKMPHYPLPLDELTAEFGGPITESDVVRLLDPLPERWDACLTLNSGEKVGDALSKLKLPDSLALNIKGMLGGDGSCLTPAERLAAENYARQLLPQDEDWPSWLGGRS